MKAQKKLKTQKLISLLLLTLFLLAIAFNLNAGAAEIIQGSEGAAVFDANCAACHQGGGNIVRRGKNLKPRALKRNGMDSIEAIASLVENGKNAMPAYKDRLSNQQILDVSAYVLEQAEKGWK